MKKLYLSLFSMLLISVLLVACSGTKSEEVDGAGAKESEVQEDEVKNIDDAPEDIKIEGIGDHYHTGDKIELTAVLDKETESGHWHWYSRENANEEWKVVEGQESEIFTAEATVNGLEVKAALFDNDNKPSAQSVPAKIVIDDHHGTDEESKKIYQGYFEDSQVKNRELSDWEGDWQSVYPYLLSGDLDEVLEHKAENGDMTKEEYKEYYTVGYKTDVDRILIKDNVVTFFEGDKEYSGKYESDGYEILTYEKGNRGVRFIFKLADGTEDMPKYIQFSDHGIFPADSHHFHLYWGDDSETLLKEVTHWPTYYPSNLDAAGIVRDMLAH
ncbi:metal-binding protein ZinT [Niallia taxi]|uniref:metal-binding protein ZinT n=1 Tax=Niallia taxi TaxID=2499688 RepID=UPI0039827FE7